MARASVSTCVSFVPFLETTAACARYHHNVGQVYNMVIRDLRERGCARVCVEKREDRRNKKREKDEKVCSTSVFFPRNLDPFSSPSCVGSYLCVSEKSFWTRSGSSFLIAPQHCPHYSPLQSITVLLFLPPSLSSSFSFTC